MASSEDEDAKLFENDPWVEPPVIMDYGYNVRLGNNVFINFNAVFLDTCLTTVGSRTLVGPNVHFYSATHPLDPAVRNGTSILPGVVIGKGSVVGAGSVVTKSVPDFTVVAGNPAKFIRKIETEMDAEQKNMKSGEQNNMEC
jgi:acetyltransferase-like isoleucine patch superfamily enzyme